MLMILARLVRSESFWAVVKVRSPHTGPEVCYIIKFRERILQQSSLAQHWARDWLALALTQVHHGSRLSDSCEGGEALSSVHPPTPATGKLIHNLLCDGRVKND